MSKICDLEERTLEFVKGVVQLCQNLSHDIINRELVSQLVRAASSVGANYRESRESLGKRDSLHRLRIARKECKEATYWLLLLQSKNLAHRELFQRFIEESNELRNILSSIIKKLE